MFFLGMVSGFITVILFIVVWIFVVPHSSFENELSSQVIVLNNNEKVLFTFDHGCQETPEPYTPVLTYLRNNNLWESKRIPEGTFDKDDEYILTTSIDKSSIYILLPQKNEGFLWNLTNNEFKLLFDIQSLETGKNYIHHLP